MVHHSGGILPQILPNSDSMPIIWSKIKTNQQGLTAEVTCNQTSNSAFNISISANRGTAYEDVFLYCNGSSTDPTSSRELSSFFKKYHIEVYTRSDHGENRL